MKLTDLATQRVAILGFGREGNATWQGIRQRLPTLPLTLFCAPGEQTQATQLNDAWLSIHTQPPTQADLCDFDVVIKSPGISPYQSPIPEARAAGVVFTSGSALWFAENPDAKTICITGTKGKSTTSALIAHLLRAIGVRTALCGNIGLPLLSFLDCAPAPDCWVIELSSFQTHDFAASPSVAVLTNVIEEHLDWHGDAATYVNDKLRILGSPNQTRRVLNAQDAVTLARIDGAQATWFNHPDGWHLFCKHLRYADRDILPLDALPLVGAHNAGNVCAALTAIAAAGYDAFATLPFLRSFIPLPHRLQTLGVRAGIEYVNDSIATTPQATQAALQHYAQENLVLILGGQDRGLDWTSLCDHLRQQSPRGILCMGATTSRILPQLRVAIGANGLLESVDSLEAAMIRAREILCGSGIVLLSPGAPSFGLFTDYVDRGKQFTTLAGFDAQAIAGISGLGIA